MALGQSGYARRLVADRRKTDPPRPGRRRVGVWVAVQGMWGAYDSTCCPPCSYLSRPRQPRGIRCIVHAISLLLLARQRAACRPLPRDRSMPHAVALRLYYVCAVQRCSMLHAQAPRQRPSSRSRMVCSKRAAVSDMRCYQRVCRLGGAAIARAAISGSVRRPWRG